MLVAIRSSRLDELAIAPHLATAVERQEAAVELAHVVRQPRVRDRGDGETRGREDLDRALDQDFFPATLHTCEQCGLFVSWRMYCAVNDRSTLPFVTWPLTE